MEKLCIDVRGFSEEKKKRVQDAFFALGIKWGGVESIHEHLDALGYTNKAFGLDDGNRLYRAIREPLEEFDGALTYPELMRKAGLDESDPDVVEDRRGIEMLDDVLEEIELNEYELGILQETIEAYLKLLDVVKNDDAQTAIQQQIEHLMDLQFKQIGGGV